MTANITGYAVFEGLATSLDTLCAQAYGSGRKEQVGLHLQRMVLLMFLIMIPIGAVWICSGWILAALVPERDLAMLAGSYLRILLASTPGYAVFEAAKRFTQAQGLFNASLFVLIISTPLNIVFNYVFVFVLHWGLTGAALATVLSNTLLPLLLWFYVFFVRPSSLECWGGFTKAAFTHWGPMVSLKFLHASPNTTPGHWSRNIADIYQGQISHTRNSNGRSRMASVRHPHLLSFIPLNRSSRCPKCGHDNLCRYVPHSFLGFCSSQYSSR